MKKEKSPPLSSPLEILILLKSRFGADNLEFEFGTYIPPVAGLSERQIIKVAAKDFSDSWIELQLQNLSEKQELAVHCWVEKSGERFFFPMIDFIGKHSEKNLKHALIDLESWLEAPLHLFSSGSSLHGYFPTLLPEKQWTFYLGSLLLLNPKPPGQVDLIDARWVGHSLQNGLCALRWSHNTQAFAKKPIALPSAEPSGSKLQARNRSSRRRNRPATTKHTRRSPAR